MLVGNLVENHYLENEMIVEYDSNLYLKYKSQRIENYPEIIIEKNNFDTLFSMMLRGE